ncbi:hypothetical protein [Xanthomonas cerealis]|nr:hypothetical protein [Xanthomonas translucens]
MSLSSPNRRRVLLAGLSAAGAGLLASPLWAVPRGKRKKPLGVALVG